MVPPGADSKNGKAEAVMSIGPLQAASKRTPSSWGNSQVRPCAAASASRGAVRTRPRMRAPRTMPMAPPPIAMRSSAVRRR